MMTEADPLVADFALRHPDAFARVLARGSYDEISAVVKTLPPESVAAVVARLPAARLRDLLDSADHSPGVWLTAAPFDNATTLLSRMRRERRLALIDSLEDRRRQRLLLRHEQYPAHSAGSLVRDVLLRIDIDSTVSAVFDEMSGLDSKEMPLLVVVDAEGRYAGVVEPWKLITRHASRRPLSELIVNIPPIAPETPAAVAASHEAWLSHNWLPVVDNRQRVLGALSRTAVMRAAAQTETSAKGTASILLELMDGMAYVLSRTLDGLTSRRSS